MNLYKDIGCSQEDHLRDCSHFGYSGLYLSDHADYCIAYSDGGRKNPCICNPSARIRKGKTEGHKANGYFTRPENSPQYTMVLCSCGWISPQRQNAIEASKDLERHQNEFR
jgi:hypothetical protein